MHLFQKSKKGRGEAKAKIPASKTMITLSQMHLFQKSKKGRGEAKAKIPASKTMITLEEDLSRRGEI